MIMTKKKITYRIKLICLVKNCAAEPELIWVSTSCANWKSLIKEPIIPLAIIKVIPLPTPLLVITSPKKIEA